MSCFDSLLGGQRGGGERFEFGHIPNDEAIGSSTDQLVALEPAHDTDHCFRRGSDHVGHILPGEADAELDALLIRHAVSCGKLDEQGCQPLICALEGQNFGFLLRFIQPIAEIFDHFERGVRAATQHLEVVFLAHAQDAHVPHGLRGAGMRGAVEGGGVTAKQVSRHQHLERAFFSVWRRLHALDGALRHDVEVLGRIALAENKVALSVVRFGQFIEHALAIRAPQDVEERNSVQRIVARGVREA